MNRKKILSIVLALSLMIGMTPVLAEEIPSGTYEYWVVSEAFDARVEWIDDLQRVVVDEKIEEF